MIARIERVRDFQPPWRTVRVLRCPACHTETRLRQNWHGPTPNGGIGCPCGEMVLGFNGRDFPRVKGV